MSNSLLRWTAAAATVIAAGLVSATPAHAGPPWISVELPSNPHESSTRGAFFLVHTYHHGTPMQFPLSGRAEGLVNGRRQTVQLEISATDKPGVYAVRYRPVTDGAWVLVFNLGKGEDGSAGMLVTIGKQGQVASVEVPSRTAEGGRWVIPRGITPEDVNRALAQQTALLDAGSDRPSGATLLLGGLGLLFGIPVARRLRAKD